VRGRRHGAALEEGVQRPDGVGEVQEAIDFAEASPQPDISTLMDMVYKESAGG